MNIAQIIYNSYRCIKAVIPFIDLNKKSFTGAKQPKTREARIEKYMQKIIEGKGLED